MDIIVGKGIKLKKDDFLIYLSDLLDELYKSLNAEIDLSVRIVKKLGKNLNKDETIYACVNYKCGKYYLYISKEIYKHYIRNDFYHIEAVLYHEFVHLYDILHLQKYASKIFIDKKLHVNMNTSKKLVSNI